MIQTPADCLSDLLEHQMTVAWVFDGALGHAKGACKCDNLGTKPVQSSTAAFQLRLAIDFMVLQIPRDPLVRLESRCPEGESHATDAVGRATFCEVWWMCASDVRCGTTQHDIPMWIAAVAHRRGGERRHAVELMERKVPPAGQASFWTGPLADHDQWTHFELATPCSMGMTTLGSLLDLACL